MRVDALLAVAVGSALGGVARYLLGHAAGAVLGRDLPWGTLVVNVLGCFALGVCLALVLGGRKNADPSQEVLVAFLFAGVLGGFTTFSAFGRETFELVREGRGTMAAIYVVGSNVLALGAVWAGWRLGASVAPMAH